MPRLRVSYDPEKSRGTGLIFVRGICLIVSVSCFLWNGRLWLDRHVHQAVARRQFSEALNGGIVPDHEGERNSRQPVVRLQIARLGVSGFVEEGFDAKTLDTAIGILPQGAKPGEAGNVILAAHRDTFFAGLRNARAGDSIVLEASDGRRYEYTAVRVFVIEPTESWVMRSTPERKMLTLITCYPFRYLGNAPQRFVVQAVLADGRGERFFNQAGI